MRAHLHTMVVLWVETAVVILLQVDVVAGLPPALLQRWPMADRDSRGVPGTVDALREWNTQNANKLSTNAMDNALRNAYSKLGIVPELFDGIHTSLDLTTEIRVARANVIRFANMLAAGTLFLEAPNGTAQSVEMLHSQSLMIVRQLVKAQKEIAPGVERAGHIKLTIAVDGGVPVDAQVNLVPNLTEDGPEELPMHEGVAAPGMDLDLDVGTGSGYDDADE